MDVPRTLPFDYLSLKSSSLFSKSVFWSEILASTVVTSASMVVTSGSMVGTSGSTVVTSESMVVTSGSTVVTTPVHRPTPCM